MPWWGLLQRLSIIPSRTSSLSLQQLLIPSLAVSSSMRSISFIFIHFHSLNQVLGHWSFSLLLFIDCKALEQQWEAWDDTWRASADFYSSNTSSAQGKVAQGLQLKPPYLWGSPLPYKRIYWQRPWNMAKQGLILDWGKRLLSFKPTCYFLLTTSYGYDLWILPIIIC